MIWDFLTKSAWERKVKSLAKNAPAEMKSFYENSVVNFKEDIEKYTIAAIDLETTGLDFEKDEILSIGCVDLGGDTLDLSSCFYDLVKPTHNEITEENIVIHGITHDQIKNAANIEEQLAGWLNVLEGKILLAHHAAVELNFMNNACQKVFKHPFSMPFIDTLLLEKNYLIRQYQGIKDGQLRITKCRDRYNLPRYPAHHALKDAISCGELFLAQKQHRYHKTPISHVVQTSF